jgi:alpha-L-glutamate ligase-like protein
MFAVARKLGEAGILGLNRRNAEFISRYNPRRYYPLVDDKLKTKELAASAGIAVPELYCVIEIEHQIRDLAALLAKHPEFVVKPAHGSAGDGILVIAGRVRNMYRKASGEFLAQHELDHHVSNVLSGLFSLGGRPDKALIESRVHFDPVFQDVTFQGVPDVRIIVFLGVPVMAMVRLPTRQSDGKANLHKGAVGAGIDIGSGRTLAAVIGNEVISEHPDTHQSVTGIQIPNWSTLLRIAAGCYELTGLGYIGVDLVLDRDRGPLMLELNARPGLNIQIANRCGLLTRLPLIEKEAKGMKDVGQRVEFAMEKFAVDTQQKV